MVPKVLITARGANVVIIVMCIYITIITTLNPPAVMNRRYLRYHKLNIYISMFSLWYKLIYASLFVQY